MARRGSHRPPLRRGVKGGPKLSCNPYEWRIWVAIQRWCHEPGDERYPRYGGRGVVVCDRWRDCFANFVQDMGGYGTWPRHTYLSRLDKTGPFSAENCWWKPREARP